MTRKYPSKDLKILYGLSQARCSSPTCRNSVILEPTANDDIAQKGKIAHIRAHSKGGPRYDEHYPKEKLDTYDNWVLLCGSCHDDIDIQWKSHTVDQILALKANHEAWISERINQNLPDITFIELEQVCKYLIKSTNLNGSDFSSTAVTKKISKNKLSIQVADYIKNGLQKAEEVGKYINHQAQILPEFPASLADQFKIKYNNLAVANASADAIFFELLSFASQGSKDLLRCTAGLTVIAYLFERCEIFEK